MDYSTYAATGYGSAPSPAATALVGLFSGVFLLIWLAVLVLLIIAFWRIFTKAGEPGWASLIPFYNTYIMYKIAWGNGWLFLLSFIPLVGMFVALVALYKLCVAFDHGAGFFLGLLFLSPIFLLILAFGSSEYVGPA